MCSEILKKEFSDRVQCMKVKFAWQLEISLFSSVASFLYGRRVLTSSARIYDVRKGNAILYIQFVNGFDLFVAFSHLFVSRLSPSFKCAMCMSLELALQIHRY